MSVIFTSEHLARLGAARVGRLATASGQGAPHVIPCCFAATETRVYTPLDAKPKRAELRRLRRVRNVAENGRAALVVDHFEEDWGRLWWLLVTGSAEVLWPEGPGEGERAAALALLREKYPQYRQMPLEQAPVIAITPQRVAFWSAAGP